MKDVELDSSVASMAVSVAVVLGLPESHPHVLAIAVAYCDSAAYMGKAMDVGYGTVSILIEGS